MDILIVSHFGSSYSEDDNDRFLYMAKELSKEHEVEIVTSSFCHEKKLHRRKTEANWPFKVVFIDEPGYSKNVCIKRFYSHFVWGVRIKNYIKTRRKPDAVYCAIPSLTGPYLIAKYCEKNGVRFVVDVQDLWPEAFQMVFNVPVLSNIAFAPFKVLANGAYKRADAICAVSDTYCERAEQVNKKVKNTTTVFLGTELASFDRYASEKTILEKKENEIWLGYAGTLGTSYDIPLVFKALKKVNNPNLRFIVMGDGPMAETFKKQAEGLNVIFTGRLDYSQMCGVLVACDMVVNPINGKSVASIINKHADYAACGKPVLNTQKSAEYRKLVNEYQMGFNCDNAEEMAEKIKILIEDESLRLEMGRNARQCAEEKFDRATTYKELRTKLQEK